MAKSSYRSKSSAKGKNSEFIASLNAQIKSKELLPVYLFFGEEIFLIDHYVNEIKKIVAGSDINGLNLVIFENKVDINDIVDACNTFPAFSDKKLVLVKNSQLFARGGKNSSKEADQDHASDNKSQQVLADYFPEIPGTTCLVFIENNVDKRLGIYKQIEKYGLAAEFSRLSADELVPWVIKGFQSLRKKVSPEAAQYLVAVSEPDMYTLKNEIVKICTYADSKDEINLNDIKLLVTPTIKSVIFDLLDAVARKEASKALKLLDDMISIKEPEQKILSMLSKQTGELLKLKILLKKGATNTQINSYFQGKHPYALKIMTQQAGMMEEDYLRNLLNACAQAETNYKKGLIDARLALEVLLSQLAG